MGRVKFIRKGFQLSVLTGYALAVVFGSLFITIMPTSAEAAVLPEPVPSSAGCVWMGEFSYDREFTATQSVVINGQTYQNSQTVVHDANAVSAPVAGQTCGMQWTGNFGSQNIRYDIAYCTPEPDDIYTETFTQHLFADPTDNISEGYHNAFLSSASNKYFLTTSALFDNADYTRSTVFSACGTDTSDSGSFEVSFQLGNYCNSPFTTHAEGFYLNSNTQATSGTCSQVLQNNTATSSSLDERTVSWRFKRVNCNASIDSDGGGVSDCQEYEDRTNPMDAADDINPDATAPVISFNAPLNGGTVVLGSSATASYSCADEMDGSGLASCTGELANGATLDTATVGLKTFEVTATDNAGNTSSSTASYTVVYGNSGFLGSINTDAVNVAKAGSVVPVQFRLVDANGNPISDSSSFVSVTSASTTCNANEPTDFIEEYAPGSSGLQYKGDGVWQFNWKTSKSYAGTCRIVNLNLADGSHTRAKFQF